MTSIGQPISKRPRQVWLMIAFLPAHGYRPAKSGKNWVRSFATREAAITAANKLVALGIGFVCRKADRRPPKPRLAINNTPIPAGFGGLLNARPTTRGAWRIRKRRD